jgi:hypothetical protein
MASTVCAGPEANFEGGKMLNRLDFFALLLFQVAVTLALGLIMQERNCAQCELSSVSEAVSEQWVLVDH